MTRFVEQMPETAYSDYFEEQSEIAITYKITNPQIPLSAFQTQLPPLQLLTKYLYDQQKLSLKQISILIGRSYTAIWQSYQKAKNRQINIRESEISIPLTIFNSKLSILESIVHYLRSFYNYSQIARLLDKDPRTIWTINSRAEKKLKK